MKRGDVECELEAETREGASCKSVCALTGSLVKLASSPAFSLVSACSSDLLNLPDSSQNYFRSSNSETSLQRGQPTLALTATTKISNGNWIATVDHYKFFNSNPTRLKSDLNWLAQLAEAKLRVQFVCREVRVGSGNSHAHAYSLLVWNF